MFRVSMGAILSLFWLKPVLVHTLRHTMPIFDFDYHNKRSNRTICHCVSAAISIGRSIRLLRRQKLIHIARTICHRVSAAIRIARSICLSRRQQYVLPEQYVIAEEQQYVQVNQYVIRKRQKYELIAPICQVQYDLQYILKFISYCPRCGCYQGAIRHFVRLLPSER